MENRSMFVGLDVHKETIDVSIAESPDPCIGVTAQQGSYSARSTMRDGEEFR